MTIEMARTVALMAALVALSACGGGGGGGGGSEPGRATNRAPSLTSSTSLTFAETDTVSFTVTVDDPDGDVVTITFDETGDGQFFLLDTATGIITANTSSGSFDFENPLDANGDNVYEQGLTLSDGTTSVLETFTVTISDVDEGPVFTNAPSVDLNENQTGALLTFTANDPEGGAVTDFRIEEVSKLGETVNAQRLLDAFSVDPLTGVLTVETPFDAEVEGTQDPIRVSVSASDTGGLRGSGGVSINLVDLPAVAVEGAVITGRSERRALGGGLFAPGDLDGDGRVEVWVTEELPQVAASGEPDPRATAYFIYGQSIADAISAGSGVADILITDLSASDLITVTGGAVTGPDDAQSLLSATSAGEIDGDTAPDVLVGFRERRDARDVADTEDGPLAAILYGSGIAANSSGSIDLTSLSASDGILLGGLSRREAVGLELAAGDVDGDGISDVILTSPETASVRIVFGDFLRGVAGGSTVDLGTAAQGEVLNVSFEDTAMALRFGVSGPVAVLGDLDGAGGEELAVVNSDGIEDKTTVISASTIATAKAAGTTLNALDSSTGTINLTVQDPRMLDLNADGDVDNDGRADLAIAYRADNLRDEAGSLVFGSAIRDALAGDTDIDLLTATAAQAIEIAVSNPGIIQDTEVNPTARIIPDADQDNRDDVLFGLDLDDALGRDNSGSFLVARGSRLASMSTRTLTVDRTILLNSEGRRLVGPASGERIGSQVFSGDIDGDGRAELIFSSALALEGSEPFGRLYIVPGTRIEAVFSGSDTEYDLAESVALEAP